MKFDFKKNIHFYNKSRKMIKEDNIHYKCGTSKKSYQG